MVTRIEDLHALWDAGSTGLTGRHSRLDEYAPDPARYGQLLLARAGRLPGLCISEHSSQEPIGMALSLAESEPAEADDCFIDGRVFAVVDDKGSMVLRLPHLIADDLVDNGLCMRMGKNLLTWPSANYHQLETNWRILLQAYWHITGTPPKRRRRLWSEWVVNHQL